MEIVQLTRNHQEIIKPLFSNNRHMGVEQSNFHLFDKTSEQPKISLVYKEDDFQQASYDAFCDAYLSDLRNFRALGSIENGIVTSMIAGFESPESPEWFWTNVRSMNRYAIKNVLDEAISYYESRGKLKFYSNFNLKYKNSYRRLVFSKYNAERYAAFDEYIVPAKTKCIHSLHWQILFNRVLVPVDCVVRCSYLKPEYRTVLPIAGNI